jgi:tripartite-type tricarboxylate transporter receptor subunit TctC
VPKKIVALAAGLLACYWALPVAAQNAAAEFYRGKTVTIVIGSTPAGTYDLYARLLGRYLGKHIPGEPTVVVTNMPGAGGEIGAAYVARVAAKDGTYIAAPDQNQPLDPILKDATRLNYDPSSLKYLGSAASEVFICIVRSDAPATTFDDMFKTRVTMGGASANGLTGYLPVMLNNVLGTKFKVVFGYASVGEILKAVQSGEIQGMCGTIWKLLNSSYPDLLKNGEIKIVAQIGDKGLPELDKMRIPLTASFAHDERQRGVLEIVDSQEIFAYPYFVAAQVPAERLKILRRAFMETWRDPDLLADAAKMRLTVGPISGEEVQSLLQKIYASPTELLQSVKEAIKPK